MAEIVKCEACGTEMERGTKYCACGVLLPQPGEPKPDYLKAIDASIRTIKRIAIWWLILSILAVLAGLIYFIDTH
jgi:hypothetical protein